MLKNIQKIIKKMDFKKIMVYYIIIFGGKIKWFIVQKQKNVQQSYLNQEQRWERYKHCFLECLTYQYVEYGDKIGIYARGNGHLKTRDTKAIKECISKYIEQGIIGRTERTLGLLENIDELKPTPSGRSRFNRSEKEEIAKKNRRRQKEAFEERLSQYHAEQEIAEQGESHDLSHHDDHDER